MSTRSIGSQSAKRTNPPSASTNLRDKELPTTAMQLVQRKIGVPLQSIFLRMLLSDEFHRQTFEDLCSKGVPRELLESYLLVICVLARRCSGNEPKLVAGENKTLPNELQRIANMIENANKSSFAPTNWVKEPYRRIYEKLPDIVRAYAFHYAHVQRSAGPVRHRRMTLAKAKTIELLANIASIVGSPNYERLATLLAGSFECTSVLQPLMGGGEPTTPKFFDAENLAKLYRSSADLMPSKLPRHHSAAR